MNTSHALRTTKVTRILLLRNDIAESLLDLILTSVSILPSRPPASMFPVACLKARAFCQAVTRATEPEVNSSLPAGGLVRHARMAVHDQKLGLHFGKFHAAILGAACVGGVVRDRFAVTDPLRGQPRGINSVGKEPAHDRLRPLLG